MSTDASVKVIRDGGEIKKIVVKMKPEGKRRQSAKAIAASKQNLKKAAAAVLETPVVTVEKVKKVKRVRKVMSKKQRKEKAAAKAAAAAAANTAFAEQMANLPENIPQGGKMFTDEEIAVRQRMANARAAKAAKRIARLG
jgi:hypothetical protein